jgi:hypothetical protein
MVIACQRRLRSACLRRPVGRFGNCSRATTTSAYRALPFRRSPRPPELRQMLFGCCMSRCHLSKLLLHLLKNKPASDSRAASLSRSYLAMSSRCRTIRHCWSSMCFLAKSTSCFAVTAGSSIKSQRFRTIVVSSFLGRVDPLTRSHSRIDASWMKAR